LGSYQVAIAFEGNDAEANCIKKEIILLSLPRRIISADSESEMYLHQYERAR
jgi:hypothetical protein